MSDLEENSKCLRPRCFFDVELGGRSIGRIVFELYSDICPVTVENFRALCTGERGLSGTSGKPLHYKGVVFHRVVKDFMIQGGDFTAGNGSGGESIYGGPFDDENFELKHDRPFLLSMANRGKNTNGSQFFITTQPAPHLDGVHVVFGHLISGQNVVSLIEDVAIDNTSRPLQDIKVINCGQLEYKGKVKSETEDSGTVPLRRKERIKKKEEKNKKHKIEKSKKTQLKQNTSKSEGVGDALAVVYNLKPDEIPAVPLNRFLFRGGKEEKPDKQNQDGIQLGKEKQEVEEEKRRKRERIHGRVVKGRGAFRYRSPHRSRSRSLTPPHWRQAQNRTITLEEHKKKQFYDSQNKNNAKH